MGDVMPIDGRDALRCSYDGLTHLVAALSTPDLARPTPCAELDVRGVLSHTLASAQMFTDVNEGKPEAQALGDPLGDRDPRSALDEVREANLASWSGPAGLQGDRGFAFGTFPAPAALAVNLGEIAVHQWDIAVATGGAGALDEQAAAIVLDLYEHVPLDYLRSRGAFGPAVPVAVDAPVTDRLLGLLGRDPRWLAPAHAG
jgi:uncharacterized protein (TIGR03086 family)